MFKELFDLLKYIIALARLAPTFLTRTKTDVFDMYNTFKKGGILLWLACWFGHCMAEWGGCICPLSALNAVMLNRKIFTSVLQPRPCSSVHCRYFSSYFIINFLLITFFLTYLFHVLRVIEIRYRWIFLNFLFHFRVYFCFHII